MGVFSSKKKDYLSENKLFIVVLLASYILTDCHLDGATQEEKAFVKRPNEVYITIWDCLTDAPFFDAKMSLTLTVKTHIRGK